MEPEIKTQHHSAQLAAETQEAGDKPVGAAGRLLASVQRNTPEVLTNNAPRVVSALKMGSSVSMLFSKNWAFRIAGGAFVVGNGIVGIFGRKKTDDERAALQQEEADTQNVSENPVIRHAQKVMQPKKYPLESGMTAMTFGSAFWLLSGIIGGTHKSIGQLVGGALSLAADATGAFAGENTDDQTTRQDKGLLGNSFSYFKNRPILTSSILNMGGAASTLAGGVVEFFKHKREPNAMISGALLLTANAFQAIFVRKNDYNIEKRKDDAPTADVAASSKNIPQAQKPGTIQNVQHEGVVSSAQREIA